MNKKGASQESLNNVDAEISELINNDLNRQNTHIHLIASENFASKAVMEASGSILTNKYSEGFPGRRYYEGCETVDQIEQLAIDRACELFEADHANVQPHSGSSANMAVYLSILEPGDTVLGMSLDQGGHLTHGSPVNFSGQLYNFVGYGLDEDTELINMETVYNMALEHKPKLIIAGYSSYSQSLDFQKFREIADEVGAHFMVDAAHFIGLVAGKVVDNPTKYADVVTATTHKALRGPRGGIILTRQEFAKDIDKNIFPGAQGGALNNQIAAKAVCFKEAMTDDFVNYQKQIIKNAKSMCKDFQKLGFETVQPQTDNHLLLLDLRNKNITGKDAEELLGKVNITLNKNSIPNDPESPFVTSGVRIGTAAVTTRGFKEEECSEIVKLIGEAIENKDKPEILQKVKIKAADLCSKFPVYK